MKKSISTILSCVALFLFLSPSLFAQQSTSNDEIIIIQKATDSNGEMKVDTKTLEKGEHFKTYLKQLNLANMDGQDVKIEVINADNVKNKLIHIEGNENEEETIFMFKPAKTDNVDHEEIEKLVITLNGSLTDTETEKKPLLGVYSETTDEGLLITGIVPNGGADKAGIEKGDILASFDGQKISSTNELIKAIAQHKVGEAVDIAYIRDGVAGQTSATLGAKKERRTYPNPTHRTRQFQIMYDYDHGGHKYKNFEDRNPCTVFIGVYTSSTRTGLKVHNIIDNTPADKSNIQVGDLIMAIDDIEVNTHQELVSERDKHLAGDYFTLSILRNGQQIEVDAQFDVCPTDETKEIVKEETPVLEETVIPELEIAQNTLELESISVFPNPTYGPVNLKFKGEAVPTTIRLTDITGKLIYEEVLNNFDGIYDNTINYSKATPGTLILTVQQDQKVYSQSLVLMERA